MGAPLTPALAATPGDLPAAHRAAYVWRFCELPGFSLSTPLDRFRVTCAPEDVLVARREPVAVVADLFGVRHLVRRGWSCCNLAHGSPEDVDSLASVPLDRRCERARPYWPPHLSPSNRLTPIRRQLIEAFGPECVVCGDPLARNVDHDHLTGLVRGYLCGSCNTAIAECRHLAGCRFVAYLAKPPALRLGLTYPRHRAASASAGFVERTGWYELVLAGGVSPGMAWLLEVPHRKRLAALGL